MIFAAVFLLMFAFALSVDAELARNMRSRRGSRSRTTSCRRLAIYRVVPAIALFGTIYVLFFALTPSRYRKQRLPQMAGRAADHRLVAGDGRAAARDASACSAATT